MELPTIETLILTDHELEAARDQIRHMAYFKWLDAGRPKNLSLKFWCDAELEWIEYFYVPHRNNEEEPPSSD